MTSTGERPVPIEERCNRLARRLKRWQGLRSKPKSEIKLALTLFCFPPNKGNVGTAAELDVFPSVFHILNRLRDDGYSVDLPGSVDELQSLFLAIIRTILQCPQMSRIECRSTNIIGYAHLSMR